MSPPQMLAVKYEDRSIAEATSKHLASFSSERRARRCAVEVGYHVGLPILIASNW